MKKKICVLVMLAIGLMTIRAFAISLDQLMVVAEDGTFLGTFENEYSRNSIFNEYGNYGSPYSSNSIMNEYGNYGSEYANMSPFNPYSNNGPWIVDINGNYYGRLSLNLYAYGVTNYSYGLAVRLKAIRDSL